MNDRMLLIVTAFVTVAATMYYLLGLLFKPDNDKLRARLQGKQATVSVEKKSSAIPILQQLGQAASKPFMPNSREKQSALRKSLGQAGIYNPAAIRAVQGGKVICLALGLLGGYGLGQMMNFLFLYLPMGGLLGYFIPTIWLKLSVSGNQKALNYGIPDALDLMVVCVEAGLTVDAAMQRVGDEMALVHPAISREFGITHMETRVGLPRQDALKNMGQRTSNPALISLAAMLNQADRFGTSIASALRIHAESMRIERQHKAEEQASKSAVKLSFPLVLFIFPATFIVLMGPVMIELFNSDLMK